MTDQTDLNDRGESPTNQKDETNSIASMLKITRRGIFKLLGMVLSGTGFARQIGTVGDVHVLATVG